MAIIKFPLCFFFSNIFKLRQLRNEGCALKYFIWFWSINKQKSPQQLQVMVASILFSYEKVIEMLIYSYIIQSPLSLSLISYMRIFLVLAFFFSMKTANLFASVVAIAFQSIFRVKMHQNNIFFILKKLIFT